MKMYINLFKKTKHIKTNIVRDINAKLGFKEDHAETSNWPFGYGTRNESGETLLKLNIMNSVFK